MVIEGEHLKRKPDAPDAPEDPDAPDAPDAPVDEHEADPGGRQSAADAAMPDAQVRSWAQVTAIETAGSPAEGAAGAEAEATTEEEDWQDCQEMPAEEQLQQQLGTATQPALAAA